MRFYGYGDPAKPAILLIPGTCCHHSMFDEVTPLLTERFYTVVASFTGFDEKDGGGDVYRSMTEETEAIEAYVGERLSGRLEAVYGSSLGGSFAAYLVQRGNIGVSHAILGSSDMDEDTGPGAKLKAKLIASLMYGMLARGALPGWMRCVNEAKLRRHPEDAAYRNKFTRLFLVPALRGGVVKKESIYNQFYSDLATKLDRHIARAGCTVHVFYARRMGEQYEQRYREFFAEPDIRARDLRHEELLLCYPERWTKEIFRCCRSRDGE